jgi:hypothetical protein
MVNKPLSSAEEEALKVLINWFHLHYLPHPERGNLFDAKVYSAREVLTIRFAGSLLSQLIDHAVHIVESHDIRQWVRGPEDLDPEDFEISVTPSSISYMPDDPGPSYGSEEDHLARDQVRSSVEELQRVLDSSPLIGLGHNRPPEALDSENGADTDLDIVVQQLREEFDAPNPRIAVVKKLARQLGSFAVEALKWAGAKLDKMADEAAKTAGKALGVAAVAMEPHVQSALLKAYEAVVNWLHVVASTF